jgi:hypothetical protein
MRMWSLPLHIDVWDGGDFRLRKRKGSLTVMWAVAQCSLIVTDRGPRVVLREAEGFSDTLVLLYQTTQRHTPEDSNLQKNVGSHKMHKFLP